MLRDIRKLGFINIEEREYHDEVAYVADYKYGDTDKLVAKYIFIKESAKGLNRLEHPYDNTLREIIENTFYALQNDAAWNLYLIIILDDNVYEDFPITIKQQFEEDKDYCRNIIIKKSEISEMLPLGKSLHKAQKEKKKNPYGDWYDILSSKNLTFCLGRYRRINIEDYLQNKPIQDNEVTPDFDKRLHEDSNLVDKIASLSLDKKFRPSCFREGGEIPFKKVNLLFGPNGSGKTSVLHAIEYTSTGKIRIASKDYMDSREMESDSSLTYLSNGSTRSLEVPRTVPERKERESEWYQSRVGPAQRDELNDMFHQHNFFSAENTLVFSYLNEQPNYKDRFTSLILGETIREIEQNYTRYRQGFEEYSTDNTREMENVEKEIENSEFVHPVNMKELEAQLINIGLCKHELANPSALFDKVIEMALTCKNIISLTNLETKELVRKKYEENALNLKKAEDSMTEIQNKKDEINNKYNQNNKRYTTLNKETDILKEEDERLSALGVHQQTLEFIYNHPASIESREEEYFKAIELTEKVNNLSDFALIYEDLKDLELSDGDYETLEKEIDQLGRGINEDKIESESLGSKLEVLANKQKESTNLIISIRTYGKAYIKTAENITECPLCGNLDINSETLENYLNEEFSSYSKQLSQLQEKDREIQLRIKANEAKKNQLIKEKENWQLFTSAKSMFRSSF